jgi:hypothetical protein
MSELKNSTGSSTLPSGNLVLGSEAIKDSITGYHEAYVYSFISQSIVSDNAIDESPILKTNAFLRILLIRKRHEDCFPIRSHQWKRLIQRLSVQSMKILCSLARYPLLVPRVHLHQPYLLLHRRHLLVHSAVDTDDNRAWVLPQRVQVLVEGASKTQHRCLGKPWTARRVQKGTRILRRWPTAWPVPVA